MPESPRYLIAAGEKEKGMEVLQRMAKINGSKLPPGTIRVETEVGFVRNVRGQGAEKKIFQLALPASYN